ncbi:MAG: hypothetical protein HFE68_08110 [Erysipelotrichaceae bacterium]|nr:hypothetical protein [Erysipelotrichaceae bacterium]
MNLEALLDQLPQIDTFMTAKELDESSFALAKQYPHMVSLRKIGESRQQHPLYCLKIGKGRKKALMYGCPHPNEPIGCMMLEHLSRLLCEHPTLAETLDTTFYMIKVSDPDGLARNEGWLKGPFTYANYAKHFFRPISDQQVEWTFPLHYKNYHFDDVLPETKAIMNLMQEIQPDFVYSLHNSSFGGVYFYVNHAHPKILKQLPLSAKRANLPLNLGEPECAFSQTYAPAIYEFLKGTQYYDYYEENLAGDPCDAMVCGGSSLDYMNTIHPDAFVMMCEEPYFYCPASSDLSLCTMSRKEAILHGFAQSRKVREELRKAIARLRPYGNPHSQYMRALSMYGDDSDREEKAQLALMDANPQIYEQPATKASWFDNDVAARWYPLLGFGMIIGCVDELLLTPLDEQAQADLAALKADCERYVDSVCAQIEESVPCKPIPIRTLVSVQLESAISVLTTLEVRT